MGVAELGVYSSIAFREMKVPNSTISQDCLENQIKKALIEYSSVLKAQLTNLENQQFNKKLIQLIKISIQQNDFFSNLHQEIFDKLMIQFPPQYAHFKNVYSNQLEKALNQVKKYEMEKQYNMNKIQMLQQQLNIYKQQTPKLYKKKYQFSYGKQKEEQTAINKNYQNKINQLQKQNEQYRKQIERLIISLKQKSKNENKYKSLFQTYGYPKEITLNYNTKVLEQLQQKTTQQTQSKSQNQQNMFKFKQMEQKIQALMSQMDEKDISLKQLTNKLNLSQQKIKQLINSISQLNNLNSKLQNSNHQLNKSISQFINSKYQLINLNSELVNSKYQLINLNSELQKKLKSKDHELQEKQKAFKINFDTSQSIIDKLNKQTTQLQNQTDNLEKQLSSTKSQLQQLKITHENINIKQKQQVDKLTQQKLSLQNDYQSLSNDYQQLFSQKLELVKSLDQSQSKNNNLCQQILSLQNKKPQRSFTHYFNGNILNIDTQEDTQWIINTIEKQIKKQIKSTKLIFRMDLLNKNNPHDYINGIPNILLIAKIQNGQIIVAYSEPAFEKNMGNIKGKLGLIIGLGNRKIFTVKKEKAKYETIEPRPITWDEDYVIWGNNDFRFRTKEKELESDYSKRNCCYQEQGNDKPVVRDLLMTGQRKTVLVDFEFYELKFEDKA